MEAKELEKKLFRPIKNGWQSIDEEERKNIFDFSKEYINFINKAETERECVKEIVKILKANNFQNIEEKESLKAGDKVYYINTEKSF